MSKPALIQVFEHHKIKYDERGVFKKHHFDALVQYNEKHHNKYFTIVHKGVQFKSYVGVIQIGGLTIEVLPKADSRTNADKGTWQHILINMLRVCRQIKVDNVSEANLRKRYNSILDIYFEMYLNEVEAILKRGLIKKYRRVKSNQLALKGKLMFAQNIQQNLIHKERFYCEHQVYDTEHLIHHILYRGLVLVKDLIGPRLKDKLNRLLFEFQGFKEIHVNKSHFDKVVLNRMSQPYEKALNIAKMIILNYAPDIKSGTDNMLTLLFDMNALWEEYIYRILHQNTPKTLSVSFQNKKKFWQSSTRTKTIRPDIIVTDNSTNPPTHYVIDTKWKIRDANDPDDNDLKQMFVYNLYWKADKSLLLYPKIDQSDSDFGEYLFQSQAQNENLCKLGFVHLVEGKSLVDASKISSSILSKIKV